jgi:hypothetical protein
MATKISPQREKIATASIGFIWTVITMIFFSFNFLFILHFLVIKYDTIIYYHCFLIPGIAGRCANTHYAFRNTKSLHERHQVSQWQTGKKVLAESWTLYHFFNSNAAR